MLKFNTLLFLLMNFLGLTAQNLVQNGGFEDHAPIECMTCHHRADKFKYTMWNWGNLSTGSPGICDCKFKRTADDVRSRSCEFEKLQPHNGCTMMQMRYQPRCMDHLHQTWGCSSYLTTSLTQPLLVGKVYEVSFWVFIESPDDLEYAKFIGMNLYTEPFNNPHGALLEGSSFPLDTVALDKWYRVNWFVKPTCELDFLVIGVFRGEDGPPTKTEGFWNIFYVDDVAVVEAKDLADAKSVRAFCKTKKQTAAGEVPFLEGTTLHFPNYSSQLSAADSVLLDSFASRAKRVPSATFTISGHTDSKGENHGQLSRQRVEAALGYLQLRHRVPSFRFVPIYAGTAMPLGANETAGGRQLNRRVEIRQLGYPLPNVMYRNLLLQVNNGTEDEARKTLLAWLNAAENDRKLLLLFDPRLAVFHGTKFWDDVQKRVKKSYQSLKNPNLTYQLDSLWAEDQKPRTLQYHIENLPTYLEDIDAGDSLWQVDFPAMTAATVAEDSVRFRRLEEMILKNGWPNISEFGDRPAKAAFLISAHTGDTAALSRLLPMLKSRCKEGDAEWLWYATLYDRWLVLEGKPQRYGTQFRMGANEAERPELLPLENKEKVNEWRAEIGLEPILNNE